MDYICAMRMTNYIKTLLFRYDCVIIPEFGAFLTKRQSAKIKNSTFSPPSKSISFNRQLIKNDGLLANHIAKTEGISYEQSLHKIYDFVDHLNEALEADKKVAFEKIGLFYTQDGKILFQSNSETNFLMDSFGTGSLTLSEIQREAQTTQKDTAIAAEASKEIELQTATAGQKSNLWRYAAVGVVAIGLSGFLTANWYSNQIKSHNLAAQKEAEHHIENKLQEATFAIDDPLPSVTFKVKAKRGKYHIVAGAFRNQKNAEKTLAQLKDQEYQAKYIGKNKFGLHEVIYDSFENRKNAFKELSRIKNNENSAAWLLVKEL